MVFLRSNSKGLLIQNQVLLSKDCFKYFDLNEGQSCSAIFKNLLTGVLELIFFSFVINFPAPTPPRFYSPEILRVGSPSKAQNLKQSDQSVLVSFFPFSC